MGACCSCMGQDRDRDLSDEDEHSRLLFDDPNTNNYGAFGDHSGEDTQTDPQEVRRETEALQKVVMRTSNNLVDIFAMVPQHTTQPTSKTVTYPIQDARVLRSQDVLAVTSSPELTTISSHLLFENTPAPSESGTSDDEELQESQTPQPVKSEGIGPLLGGFADAAHYME